MRRSNIFLAALIALPLSAQGIYNNVDKPGDPICPRIQADKDPSLEFGQRSSLGGTGGQPGAASIAVALHQNVHEFFPPGSRKDVSAFSAYGEDGKPRTVASLRGKITVIAFWSYHCEPSSQMLMELAQLYDRRDKFGFDILAVNFDATRFPSGLPTTGGWAAIKTFQMDNSGFFKQHPLPFYVPGTGKEGGSVFLDTFDSLPLLCVVDKAGGLASMDMGYTPKLVAHRLSELIREEQAAKAAKH